MGRYQLVGGAHCGSYVVTLLDYVEVEHEVDPGVVFVHSYKLRGNVLIHQGVRKKAKRKK